MELNQSERLFGEVVSYNFEKHYGFISVADGSTHFFFQSEENFLVDFEEGLILKRYLASVGDTVSFVLKPNFREEDPWVAAGLIRMTNLHRLKMIQMSVKKDFLVGTITKIGKTFFLKHRETGALVMVNSNPWHKNPEEWLEEKLGYWVKFNLSIHKEEEKVCAEIPSMPFRSSVQEIKEKIESGDLVQGKVVHRSNAGITLLLTDFYLSGNLSIKTALSEGEVEYFNTIKKGDLVSAFPIELDLAKGIVKLDFFRSRIESNLVLQATEETELDPESNSEGI